jgi:rhodanese-related sulfurtransferase
VSSEIFVNYIIPAAFIGFFLWRFMHFRRVRRQLAALLNIGGVIVDVRTPAEYQRGSSPGSINIPLDQLGSQISKLDPARPIILCCASGSRSAIAAGILRSKGFNQVINAGPWPNTVSKNAQP